MLLLRLAWCSEIIPPDDFQQVAKAMFGPRNSALKFSRILSFDQLIKSSDLGLKDSCAVDNTELLAA